MIYQQLSLPSPSELSEDPELAVLVTLTTSLRMAYFAVTSAYPNLGDGLAPHAARDEREAYASSIVKQFRALMETIDEYLGAVQRKQSWRRRPSSPTGPAF